MRRPLIAGNWKVYKTNKEAVSFVQELIPALSGLDKVDVLIAPQFIALSEVIALVGASNIFVAAQNCCWEDEGAFTGEVSPRALANLGCTHVILGHSERRHVFNETSGTINKKLNAVLKNGLIPILCVGELLKEREAGETFGVLENQLERGLDSISKEDMAGVVIAYEPVWAIGTGKTATSGQAGEAHLFIRKKVREMFGSEISSNLRILYGGSVKPENIKVLLSETDIDGALIGGASLKTDSFASIAAQANSLA